VDLLEGLAQFLHDRGLGIYTPDTTGGDVFLEHMPQLPDQCVALYLYAGDEPDSLLGYDQPSLQIRVRGTQDPRVTRARASALYGTLHGLGPVTVPSGHRILSCIGIQGGPIYIGQDGSNRHENTVNFRLEIRNKTSHRT